MPRVVVIVCALITVGMLSSTGNAQIAAGQVAAAPNSTAVPPPPPLPEAEQLPPPPPFPPMPSARPSHRWVDIGDHRRSRSRHAASRPRAHQPCRRIAPSPSSCSAVAFAQTSGEAAPLAPHDPFLSQAEIQSDHAVRELPGADQARHRHGLEQASRQPAPRPAAPFHAPSFNPAAPEVRPPVDARRLRPAPHIPRRPPTRCRRTRGYALP